MVQPGVHYISIPEGDHDTLHKQIFPVIKKEVRALEEVSSFERVWRVWGGVFGMGYGCGCGLGSGKWGVCVWRGGGRVEE